MKRRAVVLVLVLVLVACGVSRPDAGDSGSAIFAQLCSNCHGDDLGGGIGPPLGPGSNAASQPDEFLETTIMRGRGRMPSFSSTLDQDQLDRLVTYIREVQGQ